MTTGVASIHTLSDIHNYDTQVSPVPINLNTLKPSYTFDYFTDYEITFSYENTTDSVLALEGPSGNVIYDPIDIGTRPPLNVPVFHIQTWSMSNIECVFDNYAPNITPYNDKYRYVVKAVARDHTAANIEDTLTAGEFNNKTFIFNDLYPSRTYTISYDAFEHLNVNDSVSGIVIGNITVTDLRKETNIDNFALNTANVEFILLNGQRDTQISIKDLDVTFGPGHTYRARITVNGNSEDFDIGNSSHTFSNTDIDYFANIDVVLEFHYDNQTVFVLDGIDGNRLSQTFPTHAGSRLEPPTITLTHGGLSTIVANLDFTIPADLANIANMDLAVDLHFSELTESMWTEKANVRIPFEPGDTHKQYIFGNSDFQIIPYTLYKAEIASFMHTNPNSIPLSTATNTANIRGFLDDTVLNFTGLYSDEINISGNVNFKLGFYTFPDLNAYDYNIDFTFQPTDGGSNIQHIVDEGNLSSIGIVTGLNAHKTYDIYVRYKQEGEERFLLDSNGDQKVTSYASLQLAGPASFDAPRVLNSTDVDVTWANLAFSEFPFSTDFAGISNDYTWTLEYTDMNDDTHDETFAGNWDASYKYDNLRPNEVYNISLVAFRHTDDTDGNIQFGNLTANTERTTVSDNVSGTIDIANVSRDLTGDTKEIGTLVLPFVFHTDAPTNQYIVRIDIYSGHIESSVTVDPIHTEDQFIYQVTDELRFESIRLDYFTDYTFILSYKNNTHGNVYVTDSSDSPVSNSFDLDAVSSLEPPNTIRLSGKGPDFINITLDEAIHPNITDNFDVSFRVYDGSGANVDYPFGYGNVGRTFELSNLTSTTSYDIDLETWIHGGGIPFGPPTASLANVVTEDPVYLDIPRFSVTDIGYTTITVVFDSYTPNSIAGLLDSYNLQLQVSETNKLSPLYSNITASNIGYIQYTFTDLLPNNTYTVSLIDFSNYDKPDVVDSSDLPSNVDNNTTLEFIEPTVSLSNIETTLVNDSGHLSVALDGFSYASAFNYTVRFMFFNNDSSRSNTDITIQYLDNFERLEFAPELFTHPLVVHDNYTLSIRYLYDSKEIIDSLGNVIEFAFPDQVTQRTFSAPQTILTTANVESIDLSLSTFTHIPELNDLYRANIEVFDFGGDYIVTYAQFVGDSGNLIYQVNSLKPNTSYTFTLIQFNHMSDASNVSAIVFSNIDANIDKVTLTDNVSISYDNIETDLLNSDGNVAYVRFKNLNFSTDAYTKKYDMKITFENPLDGITSATSSITISNIDEFIQGDLLITYEELPGFSYFDNIETFIEVFNAEDDIVFQKDDFIPGADPFPTPTHIRLAVNDAESLTVYLEGFSPHPNIGTAELFKANVSIIQKVGSLELQAISPLDTWSNISNIDGWETFFQLIPDTTYIVRLIDFEHTNILFGSSTANAEFSTLSDNVSIAFDVANVSRSMINHNADIDTLSLPNFNFTTSAPSKLYAICGNLTDISTNQLIDSFDANVTNISQTFQIGINSSYIDYFKDYFFQIEVINLTDGDLKVTGVTGNINGTFTGMPTLPLPNINVTNQNKDNLQIKLNYTPDKKSLLANVYSTLTNDLSAYSEISNLQVVVRVQYYSHLVA